MSTEKEISTEEGNLSPSKDDGVFVEIPLNTLKREVNDSVIDDTVNEATAIPCIDNLAKSKKGVGFFVTIAGFLCNLVVKGVMKSIGFIFKAIVDNVPNIPTSTAVNFPIMMHLSFNCISVLNPIIVQKSYHVIPLFVGILGISGPLMIMSWIPKDDPNVAAFLLTSSGIVLGIGCGFQYHTGVSMLNLLVKSKKNACSNGFSLAGNTLGAIIVFFSLAAPFQYYDYANTLFYFSICTGAILFGFSLLYLIPQRFLIAYADEDLKNEIKAGKWYANLWNPEVFSNPAYYLLTLSQCLNAIGFLNLTTFLNIHLSKVMHYTDVKIAGILTTLQVCDMLGRIFVPLLADILYQRFAYTRHVIYCIGVIGTGSCMIFLDQIQTDLECYTICAAIGTFSCCFIALWNSLIKAETKDHKAFDVIYSHSLFFTGIMQMIATLAITKFVQNEDGVIEDYGLLMNLFGAILMMAAIPVIALPLFNIKCTNSKNTLKLDTVD